MKSLTAWLLRLFSGANAHWVGCRPEPKQRIYVANHSSHFDFLILWSILPGSLRRVTRAAGANDYWTATALRRKIAHYFNVALIERVNVTRKNNPLRTLLAVLESGDSLIIFPEGGRRDEDEGIREFKSGIFHLAKAKPEIELIPVFIDNAAKILPKGESLPLPLICSVYLGEPFFLGPGQTREAFLAEAKEKIESLRRQ